MAKKQKAVKIKRYKNSMNPSKGKKASSTIKNVFIGAITIGLLIGVGFLISGPFINFLDSMGTSEDTKDNQQELTQQEDSLNETTDEIQPNIQNEDEDTAITLPEVDNKIYYNANVNQLTDEDALASLVDVLKSKNITHCIIPVKDSQGYVYFDFENDYANEAKNQIILDGELVISTLAENGIEAVGGISVFKDNLITVINRDTSIFYLNTDSRWLDNELSAGGKAWANPANEDTRDYIMAIVEEAIDLGFKEILFNDYQIPHQGYLAGMDFKVSEEELVNQMSEFSKELTEVASKEDVDVIFSVDLASFKASDYSRYTQNPLELFDGEILFMARTDSVLLEEDTNYISSLAGEYSLDGTGIWIIDIAQDQDIQGVENFVKR